MLKLSCMMGDKFRGEPVATESFIYSRKHCLEESKRGETEVCSHGNLWERGNWRPFEWPMKHCHAKIDE